MQKNVPFNFYIIIYCIFNYSCINIKAGFNCCCWLRWSSFQIILYRSAIIIIFGSICWSFSLLIVCKNSEKSEKFQKWHVRNACPTNGTKFNILKVLKQLKGKTSLHICEAGTMKYFCMKFNLTLISINSFMVSAV